MTLRAKTLLIIGITLIGLVGLLYLVIRSLVLDGFAEMEVTRIERNVQQTLSAMEDEVGALRMLASDYAGWDDTYEFIADGNDAYVQSNLLDSTFRDTGVDVMIFVDRAGATRFAKMYDAAAATARPVPPTLHAVASSFPVLLDHPDTEHTVKGVIIVDDAPLLVSSHPILRSDKSGPRRGSLIMGRWLSQATRRKLERRLGFRIDWRPLTGAEDDPNWSAAAAVLQSGTPTLVTTDGDRRISATTLARDPTGAPALLMRAERGRDLLAQGRRSLGVFLVALIASGIVFGFGTLVLLERVVLRRILRLAAAVGRIGEKGDVSARLPVHGNDEIAGLTSSLNETLATLERSQGVLRYIGQHARAILWTATMRRDDEGGYHTQLEMQDEETAQRLLPLDIFYGGSYAHAWKRCVHPEDIERVQLAPIEAIESGAHSYRQEFRVRAKDGRDHWIQEEVDVEPGAGGTWRLVGVGTDITTHKEASAQLQRARDAALEVARMKSDFLANMSHEIRTPMNGIAGTAELLRSTKLSPEQDEYLDMITSSAEALLGVINDVLDFSKIEAGRIELDEDDFQLRSTVADAVELLAVRAQQQGLELVVDIDPDVPNALVGDAIRFRQILVNLVGNAIKFTDRGWVVVRVVSEPVDGRQLYLRVSVADTGAGIPPEKHELIFRSFAQADSSTTRTHGGTGLGLAISSQLAERMHGRMWLESELHHGSTFHFTVLVKRQPGVPGDELARPVPTLEGLPVLV
ncbi:MAG: PAS domain-containing protein, partial [Phycisphaerales bacterium]|nr:PAS domain-containing protein [Phycisphaerales bacterium]